MKAFWLFSISLWALSCAGGTETGNPSFDGQFALGAHSSAPSKVALRVSAGGIVVDAAWLSIDRLTLVPQDECEGARANSISAEPGIADHARVKHTVAEFSAVESAFCAAEVELAPAAGALPAGAPAELRRAPILITGRLADGTPLVVQGGSATKISVRAAEAFVIDAEHAGLFLGFDVARWLGELDFSAAEKVDDSVLLDSEHNTELLQQFEDRIAEGVELYRDDDTDGAPDPEGLIGRGSE